MKVATASGNSTFCLRGDLKGTVTAGNEAKEDPRVSVSLHYASGNCSSFDTRTKAGILGKLALQADDTPR